MPKLTSLICVFVAYSVCGWLGIEYAGMGESSLTLIWLPSGIGLAACILFGNKIWPAIWLGSFIANAPHLIDATSQFPYIKAALIGGLAATINTRIQALYAYELYQKHVGPTGINSAQKVLNLVFKILLLPSILNIALLIALYSAGGYITLTLENIALTWISGALADFHGYFVITPLITSWLYRNTQFKHYSNLNYKDLLSFTGMVIFLLMGYSGITYSIYLLLALGALIAIYRGPLQGSVFILSVSLLLTYATAQHAGPFIINSDFNSFISLLTFIFCLGLPMHLLTAKNAELQNAYEGLERQVSERTRALNNANNQLEKLSQTDDLTRIPNRRYLFTFLEQEWKRAVRNKQPLSILMIDIDFFKQYNDCYGHLKGDECLKEIASALQKSMHRPGDLVARYGGEEFMVVLPETDDALAVAQHCKLSIEALNIPHQASAASNVITVSIGYNTVYPTPALDINALISAADSALYQAKDEGRNKVSPFVITQNIHQ